MSTATVLKPTRHHPTASPANDGVTFLRIVHSEWIKFRTLRSSWITLGSAMAAMISLAALIGYQVGKDFDIQSPQDALASGPLQGYFMAQLLVAVLGVLLVSGEYSTGMIRSTLAAVPNRTSVLLAKGCAFAIVALTSMIGTSFLSFSVGQAFLSHYGHGVALSAPGTLRVILGTGVYLALIGLLGGAFGWILRSTPGAISSILGLLLVVPVVLTVLPGEWARTLLKYLPSEAGGSFASSAHLPGTLAPWTGLGVLVLWVVGAMAVAGVLLHRRDA